MEPLYVAPAGGMRWFRVVVIVSVALSAVAVVALLAADETSAALITVGVTIPTAVVLWLVLPVRYEVWQDALAIRFPWGRWRIPYDTIETVRESHLLEAYVFGGVRFATTPHRSITVLRSGRTLFRPHVVISPEGRDEFLRRLRLVMTR